MIRQSLWAMALLVATTAGAQRAWFASERDTWLREAAENIPPLTERIETPVGLVESVRDTGAFQGWRMIPAGDMDSLYGHSFKERKEVIVDFGRHMTGYFSFDIGRLSADADAPLRFRLTFAEVPAELNTPFDPYPGGLSRAWLQDEVVTVMDAPATVELSRRVAFRYVKIELLAWSSFDFAVTGMRFRSVTSASGEPKPLASTADPTIVRINRIGLATLAECMQTVYEDGPKRDRRLWIGDLYLESLANTYSFRNHGLTRRCLYLLAALADEEGLLHATVFEYPEPHPQTGQHCMDYSLLYGVTLYEYLNATGDRATAEALWPVVVRQVEHAMTYLRDDVYDMEKQPAWWLVFDWKDDLNRHAPMQGLMTFAIEQSYELAKLLGRESEVAGWPRIVSRMKAASRRVFYDRREGVVVSGPDRQRSYLGQVWMILSGTLSPREGERALRTVLADPDACYPGSPYAYHYLIEAMIRCGMNDEARRRLTEYWGGMAALGADTFWEVYDPTDHFKSPYNFFPVNSYCHAWSCTPVYFINKYADIFQK